jgi:penicillin-binding protein 1A
VYFGAGYYGVEAAARGYFGKMAAELDAAEAALLAGLIKAPSALAPDVAPAAALARRNVVLEAMRETGAIDAAAFERAIRTPLDVRPRRAAWSAAAHDAAGRPCGLYFQEEVRRWLVARFGERQVLEGGLHVRTGYDPALQLEAERAIGGRIVEIARQRRAARDLQGALVALDAATGDVRALVGGRDFHASPFNRATQARRQAGSAFKPIVFAAALERGFAPGTLLGELERPYGATPAGWWPSGDHEAAQYTLRRALKVSSNRASARLLELVGLPATLDYARRLGIESALPAVPSLALGTGEVTLLELTSAYGTFANRGLHADPVLIQRVEDARGRTLWEAPRGQYPILSVTTAYLMSSMLSDVIGGGTGYRARSAGFKRPAAGKTGTTDGFTDAWFIGYTPRLVAGVWFGLDQPAPIMHEGFAGVVAVPAWARFMKAATAGDPPDWYEMPGDIERVAICRTSGARAVDACRLALLPVGSDANVLAWLNGQAPLTPAQPHGVYEDLYPVGSAPVETCPVHGPVSPLRVIGPG